MARLTNTEWATKLLSWGTTKLGDVLYQLLRMMNEDEQTEIYHCLDVESPEVVQERVDNAYDQGYDSGRNEGPDCENCYKCDDCDILQRSGGYDDGFRRGLYEGKEIKQI